jgi:hypothetical protein
MATPTIADFYKYAALAAASYVRMGTQPESLRTSGAIFAEEAASQSDGRLPLSLARYLCGANQLPKGLRSTRSSPWPRNAQSK